MKNTQTVGYNFIMNIILTASSILFPLISFPYVSRILSPDGIGRVSFATSLISYFTMIAQLGIPTYGIRECAKLRDDKEKLSQFVSEIILINVITCVVTYVAFFSCILTISRLKADKVLLLIMSCSIVFNAAGLEWLYKGLENYAYITKRSLVFKFIAFVGMFLLVRTESDVLIYGALTILAAVGSNFCNWINARKYFSFRRIRSNSIKRHFKPIIIFFLLSIASTIYTNLDTVMIGFMVGDTEVGFYTSATKIKAALVSIVTALGTVLLPRASYYIENNKKKEFNRIAVKSIALTSMMAIPLLVYFIEFSKDCILVLSGEAYFSSIPIMIVLMPTVFFIGITNIIGMQILVPLGREKIVFLSVLGGAISDFVINMIFIPQQGALGAAIGTVIAEFIVLLIQYLGYRNVVNKMIVAVKFWKIVIASSIAGIVSFPISILNFTPIIKLMFSFIIYLLVYAIILIIEKDEIFIEMLFRLKSGIDRRKGKKDDM